MRLACWFRRRAETIFPLDTKHRDRIDYGEVRDREDALASTRDACASQANSAMRDQSHPRKPELLALLLVQ
jgi:hypothetical protein